MFNIVIVHYQIGQFKYIYKMINIFRGKTKAKHNSKMSYVRKDFDYFWEFISLNNDNNKDWVFYCLF